jgi:hypothetical protein
MLLRYAAAQRLASILLETQAQLEDVHKRCKELEADSGVRLDVENIITGVLTRVATTEQKLLQAKVCCQPCCGLPLLHNSYSVVAMALLLCFCSQARLADAEAAMRADSDVRKERSLYNTRRDSIRNHSGKDVWNGSSFSRQYRPMLNLSSTAGATARKIADDAGAANIAFTSAAAKIASLADDVAAAQMDVNSLRNKLQIVRTQAEQMKELAFVLIRHLTSDGRRFAAARQEATASQAGEWIATPNSTALARIFSSHPFLAREFAR